MKDFSQRYFVTFKLIYLESGHGKGEPDGIRATVKKVIHNLVACNPNVPIYNVEDLLDQPSKLGLRSCSKIAIAVVNCCGTFLLFNKFE